MRSYRYRFHRENLDFIKVKIGFREILLKILLYILAVFFFAIIYYVIFSLLFDTPEERGLKRENLLLSEQEKHLKTRFNQVETIMEELKVRDKEIYRAIFHADLSYQNREIQYDDYAVISNVDLTQQTMAKMKDMKKRAEVLSALFEQLNKYLATKPKDSLLAIPLIQPIENKNLIRIGASIGMRMHPFYKLLKQHTGIDFIAGMETNVFATANGKVSLVHRSSRGFGNKVEIDHGNGYVTTYSHLNTISVKEGQLVTRGQQIAQVGNTGMSVAPHLHYEVWKNGHYMDPLNYFFINITPEEYEFMIRLSTSSGQSLD